MLKYFGPFLVLQFLYLFIFSKKVRRKYLYLPSVETKAVETKIINRENRPIEFFVHKISKINSKFYYVITLFLTGSKILYQM